MKKPQFNPQEVDGLKDLLILSLVQQSGATYEGDLHAKLMRQEPLQPSEIEHIADVTRMLTLPDRLLTLRDRLEKRARESTLHPASS